MPFTENLDPFFVTSDFGDVAVHDNGIIDDREFNCIFNSPEETIQIYDRSFYDQKFYSADVSVNQVTIECKTTDAVGVLLNHTITVRGTLYYALFVNSNGLGTSLIHLSLDQV